MEAKMSAIPISEGIADLDSIPTAMTQARVEIVTPIPTKSAKKQQTIFFPVYCP